VLILETCDLDGLPVLSERLIKEVESAINPTGETVRVCASIGIVTYPESSTYGGALFHKANAAKYAAKNNRGMGLPMRVLRSAPTQTDTRSVRLPTP